MTDFTPIGRHQLNPDEPRHAVAAFVESTGEWDEFLLLTGDEDGEGAAGIALSPPEAEALVEVIKRWLWANPRPSRRPTPMPDREGAK